MRQQIEGNWSFLLSKTIWEQNLMDLKKINTQDPEYVLFKNIGPPVM
jgi:hypothetical protein